MNNRNCSFTSHKLHTVKTETKGRSVFCVERIDKDEVVAVFGGELLPLADALLMSHEQKSQCIQIEEDLVLWIASYTQSTADCINHSCEPNVGLSGQITLIAMRDIEVGEEVTYDYAMSDGSEIDEFRCECGTPTCRGIVSGRDWMIPSLQSAYREYFSPYLLRRISRRKGPATLE